MALIQEFFSGGVVTARDPSLLQPGELQQADDCVYRPFDPAIYRAPGRTAFNSVAISAAAVKGLAHLAFDRADDILLAYVGSALYSAPFTTTTGTFTAITDVGALLNAGTETLDAVAFGERYYILTGETPRRIGYVLPSTFTVANCTVQAGGFIVDTTVTNGFKNVIVGQYVSGDGGAGADWGPVRVSSITDTDTIVLDTAVVTGASQTLTFASTPFIRGQYAGMRPVTASPTVATASGSWSNTSDLGVGFYWFLYTEMYLPGVVDDDSSGFLESGFTSTPVAIEVTNVSTQGVQVTRATNVANTAANGANAATHWQVYMSSRQADSRLRPALSDYRRIGSPILITTTARLFSDSLLNQGPNVAGGEAAITGVTQFVNPSGGRSPHDAILISGPATVPISIRAGNSYNTFGLVDTGAINGGTLTGSETVLGIKVRIYGKGLAGTVVLKRGTTKRSIAQDFSTGGSYAVITLGGDNDSWGESWVPADFTNANSFGVEIQGRSTALGSGELDGVDVQVYYTGTNVNRNGIAFRTITYRSQVGTTVTDSANLPAPAATTGDIFQGQLVTNDITDTSLVRYSLPNIADSFPAPYFLRFGTKRKDVITCLRTVGQVLIVGMRSSLKRVNYLPTELDTDFQQGLAHEDLATDHGIVGPMAAAAFDMPGREGLVLAYVSYKGLHLTDGITTRFLNVDLDWPNTVNLTYLSNCVLRNYSKLNWLVLYYTPVGGTTNTKALVFSYSPDKIKSGGTLPAVGPITVSARSAAEATLDGVPYLLTGHNTDGKVYVEDNGLTDASSGSIKPVIRTRLFYPAGIDRESRNQRIYLRASAYGQTIAVNSTTTVDSTTVTSAAGFGSVVAGMYVYGNGIRPGTIVTAVGSTSSLTISQTADTTYTSHSTSLTFTDGTIAVTVRGQNLREAVTDLETSYQSTEVGGLILLAPDNQRQGLELKISKVTLPNATVVDLSTAMRLHLFAFHAADGGPEISRSST